jgi:hypothetical protein
MELRYALTHANGTVDLALDHARLVVTTKGVGALDRVRATEIALADLVAFAVLPVIAAQQAVARGVNDRSFDGELLVSHHVHGARKARRVFVSMSDPSFVAIVDALRARKPDASLIGVAPDEAYRRIGVLSPRRAVAIVIAVAIGLPLVAIALALFLHC